MKSLTAALALISTLLYSAAAHSFNCNITATPVAFGSYDPFSNVPLDSTGSITVSCNNPDKKPFPVTISINRGNSGNFNPRQMAAVSGDRLNYYLFLDPNKTTVWGDGTGGSSNLTVTTSTNIPVIANIFGRVPAGQNVGVGNYGDNLTATVIW